MKKAHEHVVYVDWKSSSADILFALREEYKEKFPCILQHNFDKLAENYAVEDTGMFLNALKQELACFGCMMCEAETESDSYALYMKPMKKSDVAAKRIQVANKLPCESVLLSQGYSMSLVANHMKGIVMLDYKSTGGAERRFCSATLDINEWPPKQGEDIELLVHRIVLHESGLFTALVKGNTLNAQGYLADKKCKVLIGEDINKIAEWQCVFEAENLKWTALEWFENTLFVADQSSVYCIKDVKNFVGNFEKVLELGNADIRWYPKFFVVGNELFLFMHQVIYKWEKKKSLFKSGYEFKPIYKIEGFNAWDFVPVGAQKVAFQVRPMHIERGATKSELTVLDTATRKVETYPCHYGYVRKWKDNRVCVLPINVTSKMPIIECFDFDTFEKRCLMYGALGADSVRNIYETDAGTIIEGNAKTLYLTKELWKSMKSAEENEDGIV